MRNIRKACSEDLNRIAEIEVFAYRLNFYPIFRNDWFYFQEFQVPNRIRIHGENLEHIWVYDDGATKGFIQIDGSEVKKLFVEPILQGSGIGGKLLAFAVSQGADHLWALEKNTRAVAFYRRHGFCPTGERKPEEGTAEYLIRMVRAG